MSWGSIGIQKASSAPPKISCYTTHVNQFTQDILKICGISPTAKTVLKYLPASDTSFTISSLSQGLNVVHPDVKIYRCHQTSVFWLILHGKFCNYMGREFIYMYICLMRHLILLIIVILIILS